jgi:hypothetical protein
MYQVLQMEVLEITLSLIQGQAVVVAVLFQQRMQVAMAVLAS